MTDTKTPTGCSFLIEPVGSTPIFTPEQFSEEQRMFGDTADEFMRREVLPHIESLEKQDFDKMMEYLTFRTDRSTDDDGGNAMMAAVEYWNEGVVFNATRNGVAVMRSFTDDHENDL